MIEGRRQAARKRRDSALAALALSGLVAAVALLVTSAGPADVRELAAYRAGTLALAGWAIAIGLAYVYRPPR